jgi:hypothetical protein
MSIVVNMTFDSVEDLLNALGAVRLDQARFAISDAEAFDEARARGLLGGEPSRPGAPTTGETAPAAPESEPPAEKPRRGRPRKAEAPAPEAPDPEPHEGREEDGKAPAYSAALTDEETALSPDKAKIRALAMLKSAFPTHRDEINALRVDFGGGMLSDVPDERCHELLARAKALLGAAPAGEGGGSWL